MIALAFLKKYALLIVAAVAVAGTIGGTIYGMSLGRKLEKADYLTTVVAALQEQNELWDRSLKDAAEQTERDQKEIAELRKKVDGYETDDRCLLDEPTAGGLRDIR